MIPAQLRAEEASNTPRIPDQLLQAVAFVYGSAKDARTGKAVGGTAFFVTVPRSSGEESNYVVTCSHVVGHGGTVLRLNTISGGIAIVDIPAQRWVPHSAGDDVAIAAIDLDADWAVQSLDWSAIFGTRGAYEDRMDELNVGVGDEVFMLGRFVAHDGGQRNEPLARFGNIAMMPGERVEDGRGTRVEAFLVEMRSLAGFSGSPVFLYMGPGAYRGTEDGRMMPFYSETIGLLGIDTGHKLLRAPVQRRGSNDVVDPSWEVRQNTGIAIVAPAWVIDDVFAEVEGQS